MNVFSGEIYIYFDAAGAWLIVAWTFVFGSAIGSFLNVVAYRLPLGMNLSRPGSRCPSCERPIRWYHNVPIAGWLMLRGRCADCGAAISPRYPTVELIAALASALVAWAAIMPTRIEDGMQLYSTDLVLIGYQLVLVWTLLCAALLEFDGSQPPLKLLLAVLAIGVLVPVALARPDGSPSGIVLGAATAVLFSALAWPLLIEGSSREKIRAALIRAAELIVAGVFLGAKATAAIAVIATAIFLLTRLAAIRWPQASRFAWAAALLAGTLVVIVALGPRLVDRWRWSELPDARELLLAAGAIVALLAIVGRALRGLASAASTRRTR
jgi:leader peptidase (prepilin peptidase) / N-methyltransferase